MIDFIAVGRVAFWTAVRDGVIDAHETLCSALGETHLHLSVAPLSLFCAGLPARVWRQVGKWLFTAIQMGLFMLPLKMVF